MYRLVWTRQFRRRVREFLRQHPDLIERFRNHIKIIEKNPIDAKLRPHLLKGALRGKCGLSLNYEYRFIIEIDQSEKSVIFHDIGSHDEDY
ncbi:plasmid stabilization protein [bacterium]|nr:plasmid stabilization protein [bacterium]